MNAVASLPELDSSPPTAVPAASTLAQPMDEGVFNDGVGRAPHVFLWLLVFMVGAFFLWAAFAPLDIVSITDGEVIPSTQVKQVQHLEGGIVRKILIKEGAMVKRGQPVVELETASSGADVNEIKERLASLTMERLRLEAEAADKNELVIDPAIAKKYPILVPQTLDLFRSRRNTLASKLTTQQEIIVQRRQDLAETETRIRNQKQRFALIDEQVKISEKLLAQDITNRYNHLDLLKEHNALKSRVEEDQVALVRFDAMHKEAQGQLSSIRNGYNEEVRKQLEEVRRQINEYMARLGKYQDNLTRTVVVSPVDGVVKTMHVFTEGGVIQPGGPVMEIVPGEDRLVIEAKLRIQDIGYVELKQVATIRLASADSTRFGIIEGEVVNVSPDTITTKDGVPYYKVRIETKRDYFEHGSQRYRLFPGMIVMVNIHTGTRTILEYLLSPFQYSMDVALGER